MSQKAAYSRIPRVTNRAVAVSRGRGKEFRGNVGACFHFQQKEPTLHPHIIKQARQSGQLNLSNRGMVEVPDVVWNINNITPEESKMLSVSLDDTDGERWWDQVDLTKLILASNKLSTIPSEISNLQALTVFDVHDNQLTTLPDSIGDLQALTRLNLSHNCLQALPKSIFQLKEMHSLLLQYNQLEELDKDIGNLLFLEQLDLSHNKLVSIPCTIGYLSHVSKLNLSNNKLKMLPPEIGSMDALRSLDITHNFLTELPEELGILLHLEQLYVHHNHLVCLPLFRGSTVLKEVQAGNNRISEISPELLETLMTVKVLDLRDNKISVIPDQITMLRGLEHLNLTNNNLSSLPIALGIMSHLKFLSVEGNPMKSIRRDVIQRGTVHLLRWLRSKMEGSFSESDDGGSCVHQEIGLCSVDRFNLHVTRTLDLSNKGVKNIPEELVKMAIEEDVTSVDLSKNALADVPSSLSTLSMKISELILAFNKFSSLSPVVGNFSRLLYLDLRNNQLNNLPLELSTLTLLKEVNLCNNRFEEFPSVIFTFEKLEILLASDNKIRIVNVSGLAKLPVLTVLDLQNNDISNVPPELGKLRQLRSLQLEGNPFRNPRPSILAKGTPALLEYLRDRIPC
ncbi:leucine-rich repeat-containing protein 40-like isoform X1 [Tachypleus tridentatus]|uniref:leucine-rich repeat-containing protein 40-like isoform X1 n=1 Tax=Tachypleus tridentatus TaxID=6853 RepID=UPI003FCFB084